MDKGIGSVVKGAKSAVLDQWRKRMVQLSVYAAVLFYIVANPAVFKFMMSLLPVRVTQLNLLLLHSVLFGVLMYVGTMFVFDPLLRDIGAI